MIKERREDPDEMGAIALPTGDLLQSLIHNRKIDLTEADIQDKSKGDAFSKALVLFQILWFAFQFFSRINPPHYLPLTALEYLTLLYVSINFMTYACWWNKPQNLQVPMRIYLNEVSKASPGVDKLHNSLVDEMEYPTQTAHPIEDPELLPLHPIHSEMTEQRVKDYKPSWASFFLDMSKGGSCDVLASQSYFTKCCISYNGNSTDLGPLGGAYDRGGWAFWGWMCLLWVIHYGGWFLSFPSSVEERLWILSTVLMLLLVFFIYLIHLRLHYFPASRTANVLLRFIVFFIFPVVRVYSLVQILVLLRGLPRGLYCPISWTEYFPHF